MTTTEGRIFAYQDVADMFRQHDLIMAEYLDEIANAVEKGKADRYDQARAGIAHRLRIQKWNRDNDFWRDFEKQKEYMKEIQVRMKECEHIWTTASITSSAKENTLWSCVKCGKQRQGSSP